MLAKPNDESGPVTELNEKQIRRVSRFAGGFLLLFGMALAVIVIGTAWAGLVNKPGEKHGWIIWAVLASIASFCLSVGYRLLFQRPNKYRSILPPGGWMILGLVFLGIPVMMFFDGNSKEALSDGEGAGGALGLGVLCVARGIQLLKQAKPVPSDPLVETR